jgi:hypothetical protein
MLAVWTLLTFTMLAPIPKAEQLPPITEEMWKTSSDQLKQIGIALHNYHDVYGHFPQNVVDAKGVALLSWRVVIVPYLEIPDDQKPEFHLTEAWDSPHNQKLVSKMPDVFKPVRAKPPQGHTFYRGFAGPGAFFDGKRKPTTMAAIVDGCSNTAMVTESEKPIPWSQPVDIDFDPKADLPKLGGVFDGHMAMLLVDGSVIRIKKDADAATMKNLIQINDGNAISVDAVKLETKK